MNDKETLHVFFVFMQKSATEALELCMITVSKFFVCVMKNERFRLLSIVASFSLFHDSLLRFKNVTHQPCCIAKHMVHAVSSDVPESQQK